MVERKPLLESMSACIALTWGKSFGRGAWPRVQLCTQTARCGPSGSSQGWRSADWVHLRPCLLRTAGGAGYGASCPAVVSMWCVAMRRHAPRHAACLHLALRSVRGIYGLVRTVVGGRLAAVKLSTGAHQPTIVGRSAWSQTRLPLPFVRLLPAMPNELSQRTAKQRRM